MNCYHCKSKLIWCGDHDYESCNMEGEGIVSNLYCRNCNSFVLVYMPIGENNETKTN